MDGTWYARIQTTAAGIHLYELVAATTDEEQEARAQRIAELCVEYGIPEDWAGHPDRDAEGWDVSIIDGPVHPKLLAIATVHPLEEG